MKDIATLTTTDHHGLAEGDIVFLTPRPRRPSWPWLLLIVPWLLYRSSMRKWLRSGCRVTGVTNTTLTIDGQP